MTAAANIPDLTAFVRDADVEDLPALAGRLREAELLLEQRLRPSLPTAAVQGDDPEPALLTYRQAAQRLGVSVSYVETLAAQGKLPLVRLPSTNKAGHTRGGRLVRLRPADLHDWIVQHCG